MMPDRRTRQLQRRLARSMRAISREMATYSDAKLQLLAAEPEERAAMEKVLRDCRGAIERSTDAKAIGPLVIQVRRLQHALDHPVVAA